jgi:hypothetical protein
LDGFTDATLGLIDDIDDIEPESADDDDGVVALATVVLVLALLCSPPARVDIPVEIRVGIACSQELGSRRAGRIRMVPGNSVESLSVSHSIARSPGGYRRLLLTDSYRPT